MSSVRSGFSLLELLVAITILALVVGLVGAQWTPPSPGQHTLADSVRDAATVNARVTIGCDSTRTGDVCAAAYPNGRVITDSGEDVQ